MAMSQPLTLMDKDLMSMSELVIEEFTYGEK